MILAIENSPTDLRAQVYRQAYGSNKAYYTDCYVGDTISKNRVTIDAGLRYDQQWGKALPSQTQANAAFPNVVPGLSFAGYGTPFSWKDLSPRAGLTYALDESRKTVARASFSRYAGQLETGTVGVANPRRHNHQCRRARTGSQRRSPGAGERSAAESVHHRRRRLQSGEPDVRHLGERA